MVKSEIRQRGDVLLMFDEAVTSVEELPDMTDRYLTLLQLQMFTNK